MSRRSAQLRAVASKLIKTHDEWVNDPNSGDNPDESYWDAVSDVVKAFDAGEIPADIRTLADAVNRFADEVDKYDDRENEHDQYPQEAFWRTLEGIRSVLDGPARRELPPLEPMAELRKLPYMQDVQIALMYGLKDRRGNPMPQLVQKEIDSPGSVLKTRGAVDGRDWVDPRLAEIDAQDNAAEVASEEIERSEALARKGRRSRQESAPCHESPQELWEQGVSPAQAAAMLKQDEQTVAKQFAQWTAAAEFNRKVWDLSDKNVPIADICKQLRTDPKKVEAAIAARPAVGVGADGE